MLRNNADVRRCSYFELGLPVVQVDYKRGHRSAFSNIAFFVFLMPLFACGSVRQGLDPEHFSDESRGRLEIFIICVWLLYLTIRKY